MTTTSPLLSAYDLFRASRRPRGAFPFELAIFLLALIACCAPAVAQSANTPSYDAGNQNSVRTGRLDVRAFEQYIAYWTTEASWHSELQLKNNQIDRDLTVVPVLRTPDGAETSLPAVTIKPQEVQLVDIGALAPQLRQIYGSVVLRYTASGSRGLYAAVMIHDMGHPIAFHLDAVDGSPGSDPGTREGVWWLPKDTTNDYLVLTNQGNNPMHLSLSLYDASGKETRQRLELGSRQTSRYSVHQLIQSAGITGTYGGVRVSAGSNAAFLDTVHFLFDEQAGFSAILKMFDHEPNAKIEKRDLTRTGAWTLRAPMLALSQPDPVLGFPDGAVLQPQIFVRNTTGNPIVASLRFNWRGDSTTGSAPGPELRLAPFETRRIDVAALQDGKALPKEAHWAAVILTTRGIPDEVMAVAASYDESLRYGAQTPFNDQLSFHWEGGMWEYDVQHDSVITFGNGGRRPTRAAFTIFYNQGKEQYQLEQTLQPDAQMWIQMGKLIREQLPDKNGKTLPPDLTSGSYQIRDLSHSGAGTLFEGKVIYDKTYGNVAYGCSGQCCYAGARLINNPLGIPFLGTTTNGVNGNDNCGFTDDVSTDFWGNWKTANQSIATVDTHGMHTGVAVGSTNSSTQGKLLSPYGRYQCTNQTYTPGGGDNVNPCPDSASTTLTEALNLTSVYPNLLSGIGGVARVTVGPSSSTWNGQVVTETVSLGSNTCPAPSFPIACSGSATFVIGASYQPSVKEGNSVVSVGPILVAATNQFFDQYSITSNVSLLDQYGGGTQCVQSCSQQYKNACGHQILNHTFTYTFTKSTISGTKVTLVTMTE